MLDFPLEGGKFVKIESVNFPGVGNFQTLSQVARSAKSSYSDDNYWIGVHFIELPYKIEDKIARYIFRMQRRVVISSAK
jgi:c-di-GMP-binding flagellar brake protein YcgR